MKLTIDQQEKGQELFRTIINKAWNNDSFKKELIENPKAMIQEVIGKEINLPENKTIIVEDQSDPTTIFLNIPTKVNLDNIELTDEQLEIVAGGELVLIAVGVLIGAWIGVMAYGAGMHSK